MLKICDICVIVTPEYIGKSTKQRIKEAKDLGKEVYIWVSNELRLYEEEKY